MVNISADAYTRVQHDLKDRSLTSLENSYRAYIAVAEKDNMRQEADFFKACL